MSSSLSQRIFNNKLFLMYMTLGKHGRLFCQESWKTLLEHFFLLVAYKFRMCKMYICKCTFANGKCSQNQNSNVQITVAVNICFSTSVAVDVLVYIDTIPHLTLYPVHSESLSCGDRGCQGSKPGTFVQFAVYTCRVYRNHVQK